MQVGARRCLVCDCEGTMRLDGAGLARSLGASGEAPVVHRQLCGAQLDRYREALDAGGPLLVACTQEAPLFGEVAAERAGNVAFANIRERAGWSGEGAAAGPKMAALLAEAAAAAEAPAPDVLTLVSQGRCLVYGRDETALETAKRLAGQGLEVTLLLAPGADVKPPAIRNVPVLSGRLRRLTGHLGAFAAEVDGLAGMTPSSRSRARFGAPAAEPATLEADLVVDLSGDLSLVPAPEKRDGYLRADPRSPAAMAELLLAAGGLVGEFDKPRYVAFRAELCVHSRNPPHRLHPLPGPVPDGRHHPRRQHRSDRPVRLRRLRQLLRRVPDRGRHLRGAHPQRRAGAPARAAGRLPRRGRH
jgi:hypothetical protein